MPLHFVHSVAAGGKKRMSTSDRYRPIAALRSQTLTIDAGTCVFGLHAQHKVFQQIIPWHSGVYLNLHCHEKCGFIYLEILKLSYCDFLGRSNSGLGAGDGLVAKPSFNA